MGIKKKFGDFIEWAGRAETLYTLGKVYALPVALPVVTVVLGYLEGQPWMWVSMAACLAFAGVAVGVLSVSSYRERKNPAHKLVYEGTQFNSDLAPAPMPHLIHGNRGARRAMAREKQEPRILGPTEISPHVSRKLVKGQISVQVKNRAHFPISCLLFNASTKLEDFTPPRSTFPKKPKLLGPGESVLLSDDPIDMDDFPCGPLGGELDFTIRYGRPGDERHELHLHGNVQIQIEHFGFVSAVQTHWLL